MLSGNFLQDFYCLWLYILLITKIDTNKLLFSLADLLDEGIKRKQCSVCLFWVLLWTHSPLSILPQSTANTGSILRVWHQQKVLTTAMKGLLNPSIILKEMLCPCFCLSASMPGQALQTGPLYPQEKSRVGPGGKGPMFRCAQSIMPKGKQRKYLTNS